MTWFYCLELIGIRCNVMMVHKRLLISVLNFYYLLKYIYNFLSSFMHFLLAANAINSAVTPLYLKSTAIISVSPNSSLKFTLLCTFVAKILGRLKLQSGSHFILNAADSSLHTGTVFLPSTIKLHPEWILWPSNCSVV